MKNIFQKNKKNTNDIFFKPIDIGDNTIPNVTNNVNKPGKIRYDGRGKKTCNKFKRVPCYL